MWNIAIGALGKLKQAQGALEHVIERASEIYEGCEDCAREKSEAYATLTDLSKAAEALTLAYNLIDRQIANALNIGEAEERKNAEAAKSSFFERVVDFINSETPDNEAIFHTEIAAQELLNDIKRDEANNTASAAKPS
jgi:hypothetical protein